MVRLPNPSFFDFPFLPLGTDKYFILQLIKTSNSWVVYTHWGRTGTAGQALLQDFDDDQSDAIKCFDNKFKKK